MASMKNGKSALEYVREDMIEAEAALMQADKKLATAPLPNFALCAAGGKDYHEAMATGFRALGAAQLVTIQWLRIQAENEIDRVASGTPKPRENDALGAARALARSGSGKWWAAAVMVGCLTALAFKFF